MLVRLPTCFHAHLSTQSPHKWLIRSILELHCSALKTFFFSCYLHNGNQAHYLTFKGLQILVPIYFYDSSYTNLSYRLMLSKLFSKSNRTLIPSPRSQQLLTKNIVPISLSVTVSRRSYHFDFYKLAISFLKLFPRNVSIP